MKNSVQPQQHLVLPADLLLFPQHHSTENPPGASGRKLQYLLFQKSLCLTAQRVERPCIRPNSLKTSALQIPFNFSCVIIASFIELSRVGWQGNLLQVPGKAHFHTRHHCTFCQFIFYIYFYLFHGILVGIT